MNARTRIHARTYFIGNEPLSLVSASYMGARVCVRVSVCGWCARVQVGCKCAQDIPETDPCQ